MAKTTEENSLYNHLETMSTQDLLININNEDRKVANAVYKSIEKIEELVEIIVTKLSNGGRLFYIGSGTSGRLAIVDASECPPTFGVSNNLVIALIAGGDKAIRSAVEAAEDNTEQAWKDLKKHNITQKDIVIGISASGTTPYVVGGLKKCRENLIYTGCITCNNDMLIGQYSDTPIVILVGPEFVTGSTRMKAGTAQKLVLNMLSTSVMIKLGHIIDNKMIDMQLKNNKLKERGIHMIQEICNINRDLAEKLLTKHHNVRLAIQDFKKDE
tara:strand:- start:2376 stop:3188 length:813 start_codon:yes stop_codon:yes gene_type:complete